MTTSDYLTQLQQDREDLVDNLETMGITGLTGDETFTELVPEVLNISGGGTDLSEYFNSTIQYNTSTSYNILHECVKKFPDEMTIASSVTSLQYLFYKCDVLTEFPKLIGGNNVTNMQYLFNTDKSITLTKQVDLSGLNTSNVTNMEGMFTKMNGLNTIDVSNFNTSKVTTMNSMFNCTGFTSLDLSSFTTTALKNTGYMFEGSTSLEFLDLRSFDFTTITTTARMFGLAARNDKVPANCEIIVADQTQKNWVTTNFSWLTNVKTVAEYETE